MECPRCGASDHSSPSTCPHCGLCLSLLTSSLGSDLVRLDSLTDAAHCLRLREAQHLQHDLESFHQSFPQVFLAVYLGVLPATPSPPELAFWLLNHAAFHPPDAVRLNERAILLIIDPVARQAGLCAGYAMEALLPAALLQKILRRIRTSLWHAEYAGAISTVIQLLAKNLRKAGQRTDRRPDFALPDQDAGAFHVPGLQPLREPAPDSLAPAPATF